MYWHFLGDIGYIYFSAQPLSPYPIRDEQLALRAYGSTGGQARKLTQELLLGALKKMHEAAECQSSEHAAQCMAILLAHDPKFPPIPDWLQEEFEYHREAVEEVLTGEPTGGKCFHRGRLPG